MTSHDNHTHIFVSSRDLPFEGGWEMQSTSRRKHTAVCENIVQPVSTRYALPIRVGLWREVT